MHGETEIVNGVFVAAIPHSYAVGALTTEVSPGDRETYERLWRAARTARQDAIKARESLKAWNDVVRIATARIFVYGRARQKLAGKYDLWRHYR